jgi:hypothetical protein
MNNNMTDNNALLVSNKAKLACKSSQKEVLHHFPDVREVIKSLKGADHEINDIKLGVPDTRALADFLPAVTIKAKDLATEITNFGVKKDPEAFKVRGEEALNHFEDLLVMV